MATVDLEVLLLAYFLSIVSILALRKKICDRIDALQDALRGSVMEAQYLRGSARSA
jgi:hypothetical protein